MPNNIVRIIQYESGKYFDGSCVVIDQKQGST